MNIRLFPQMNWLLEAIQDPASGRASSKRLSLVIATIAMSGALMTIAAASLSGHDVALALAAVAGPLSALTGGSYVGGIHADAKREKKDGA